MKVISNRIKINGYLNFESNERNGLTKIADAPREWGVNGGRILILCIYKTKFQPDVRLEDQLDYYWDGKLVLQYLDDDLINDIIADIENYLNQL